ncbi:hypothetical protein PHMEG_00030309, partial [Phytophthora megakarya]
MTDAKADLREKRGSNALHLALQQTFDIDKLVGAFLAHLPSEQEYATFSNLDEGSGHSCLHTSIIKNFRQVSIALIRSGKIQVNATTRDGGWTPLHLAVITEEIDVIQELLATGAMVDAIDADSQTPLIQACLGGQLKIVRLLLDAGANPSHQNRQAHSPLHYLAAFCRDRQLLRDIIANGADVNAKSLKLNTPMHFAAMNGNEVATQVLLEHGASASVINEDKRSVVYLAKKWRHRSVEDLVRPPEDDERSDVHSSLSRQKPRSAAIASRQAQLRSMGQHTRGTSRSRPRTAMITTRSEESESESLYDYEDDELILPPSTPWPIDVEYLKTSNNNSSNTRTNASCTSFSELRDRFMGERSPLKPVVLPQDRQKVLMDEIVASRVKKEDKLSFNPMMRFSRRIIYQYQTHHEIVASRVKKEDKLSFNPMMRFSRRIIVKPVCIPWDMTIPVSNTSKADALSNQRKLKPSIRTNIGLLRDHFAHTQQLHWPKQSGHSPKYGSENEEISFIRRVAAPDRRSKRSKKRFALVGAATVVIGASAGVGYVTLQSGHLSSSTQMSANLVVPDFVESMGDPYYPSFDELDQDGDGIVTYAEYMKDLNKIWDQDKEDIANSDLPDIVKEDLNDQLDDKIKSDSACVKKAMIPTKKRQLTFDRKTIDSLYYMLEVYCFETPIEIPKKYFKMFPETEAPAPPALVIPVIPAATSAPIVVPGTKGEQVITLVGPPDNGEQKVSIATGGEVVTTTVQVAQTPSGGEKLEIPSPGGQTTTITIPENKVPTESGESVKTIEIDTPQGPSTVTINGPVIDNKQEVTITDAKGSTTTTQVDVTKTSDSTTALELPTGPSGQTTTVTIPSPESGEGQQTTYGTMSGQ